MSIKNIRYLRREEIDIAKWDECIDQAPNGLIYATSIYLDCFTNWHALVLNDYEAVMPLPWRKKFGFYYLYQPIFCQQLGIFSKRNTDLSLTNEFLQKIPAYYSLWEIKLNAGNNTQEFNTTIHRNYLLSLNRTYENLRSAYSRSAKRNIAKAIAAGISIQENIQPDLVIELHRKRFGTKRGIPPNDYEKLSLLFSKLRSEERVITFAAQNSNQEIIASSAYLLFKKRLTFIINGNLQESLQNGATHHLKDHVIRKFAQRDIIMDFEGSDNPAFARFYEQFNATDIELYTAIHNNKLPWPLRLLKAPTRSK
jgi:hypothetical protein